MHNKQQQYPHPFPPRQQKKETLPFMAQLGDEACCSGSVLGGSDVLGKTFPSFHSEYTHTHTHTHPHTHTYTHTESTHTLKTHTETHTHTHTNRHTHTHTHTHTHA